MLPHIKINSCKNEHNFSKFNFTFDKIIKIFENLIYDVIIKYLNYVCKLTTVNFLIPIFPFYVFLKSFDISACNLCDYRI